MLKESSKLMKGNERYEGYGIDLLDALSDKLHFTYEMHPVKDGKYGRQDPKTLEWDGMIGEVINGVSTVYILVLCYLTMVTDLGRDFLFLKIRI